MDTYSILRAFADSWFLIAMFAFFLGCGIWAFWPSQRGNREDASQIPFRNEQLRGAGQTDKLTEADHG